MLRTCMCHHQYSLMEVYLKTVLAAPQVLFASRFSNKTRTGADRKRLGSTPCYVVSLKCSKMCGDAEMLPPEGQG